MKNIRLFRDKEAYKAIAPYLSYPHLSLVKDKDGTGQIKYEFEEKLTATYRVTKEMIEAYPDGVPLTTNATRLIKSVKIKGVETVFERPEINEDDTESVKGGWREIGWEKKTVLLKRQDNSTGGIYNTPIEMYVPEPGNHWIDVARYLKEGRKEDFLAMKWKLSRPLEEYDRSLNVEYDTFSDTFCVDFVSYVRVAEPIFRYIEVGQIIYDEENLTLKLNPEFIENMFTRYEEGGYDGGIYSEEEIGKYLIPYMSAVDSVWYDSEGQVPPELKTYFWDDSLAATGGSGNQIKLPADSAPGIYRVEYKFWEDVEEINGEELNSEALVSLDFNIKRDWRLNSYAFAMCENLEKVNLGNRIKYVGDYAFAGCPKIKEITLPSSIEALGNNIFMNSAIEGEHLTIACDCLRKTRKSFYLNDDKIISGMIPAMPDLMSMATAASSTEIDIDKFEVLHEYFGISTPFSNSGFSEITFEDGVTSTGAFTFSNLKNLKKINFNTTLKHIDAGAFFGSVNKVTKITIPDSVESIDGFAFMSFIGAAKVAEFRMLRRYSQAEFFNTEAINQALSQYVSRKTITLGKGLKNLAVDAFTGNPCDLIVKSECLEIDRSNVNRELVAPFLFMLSGLGFKDDMASNQSFLDPSPAATALIMSNFDLARSVVFEEGVTRIPEKMMSSDFIKLGACYYRPSSYDYIRPDDFFSQLNSCKLPSTLVEIGDEAFCGTSLTSIEFPEGLKKIGADAFAWCKILEVTTLPESLEYLAASAFYKAFFPFVVITQDEVRFQTFGKWITAFQCGHFQYDDSGNLVERNEIEITFPEGGYKIAAGLIPMSYHYMDMEIGLNTSNFDELKKIKLNIPSDIQIFGSIVDKNIIKNLLSNFIMMLLPGPSSEYDKEHEEWYQYYQSQNPYYIPGHNFPEVIFSVSEDNAHLKALDNGLTIINQDSQTLINSYTTNIPEGIKHIEDYAYSFKLNARGDIFNLTANKNLSDINWETITIPDSVETIGKYAFFGINYKNLILSKNLSEIKEGTFVHTGNGSEISVEIPENIKKLKSFSIPLNFIKDYTIPETVDYIGDLIVAPTGGQLEMIYHNGGSEYAILPPSVSFSMFGGFSEIGDLIGGGNSGNIITNVLSSLSIFNIISSLHIKSKCPYYNTPSLLSWILRGTFNTIFPLFTGGYGVNKVTKPEFADYDFMVGLPSKIIRDIIQNQGLPSIFPETAVEMIGLSAENHYEGAEYVGIEVIGLSGDNKTIRVNSQGETYLLRWADVFKWMDPESGEEKTLYERHTKKINFGLNVSKEEVIKEVEVGHDKFKETITLIQGPSEYLELRAVYDIVDNRTSEYLEANIPLETILFNDPGTIFRINGGEIEECSSDSYYYAFNEFGRHEVIFYLDPTKFEYINSDIFDISSKVSSASAFLPKLTELWIPSGLIGVDFYNAGNIDSLVHFANTLKVLSLPSTLECINSDEGCITCLEELHIEDLESYLYIYYNNWPLLEYNETPCNLFINGELITDLVLPEARGDWDGEYSWGSFFPNFTGFTSVYIPKSVSYIPFGMFYGCTGISDITLESDSKIWFEGEEFADTAWFQELKEEPVVWLGDRPYYVDYDALPESFELVVPEGITTLYWFNGCEKLISVKTSSTVKYISDGFNECINLSTVQLNEGLEEIHYSFSGTNISNLEIPNSVKGIAFVLSETPWYEAQEDGPLYLGNHLVGYKNLETETLVVREGTKSVYYGESELLLNVTLPESVKIIESWGFEYCLNLQSIILPEGLEEIRSGAFDCSGLNSIDIPDSVKTIKGDAFYWCRNLTSAVLPKDLNGISRSLFYGCISLESIIIPNGVETIESCSFSGCSSLKEITLGSGVSRIDWGAFEGISSEVKVNINSLEHWCNIEFYDILANPVSFSENGNTSLYVNGELVTDIIIPEGITEIKPYAFNYQNNWIEVDSIITPDSLGKIHDEAFYGIDSLSTHIGAQLTYEALSGLPMGTMSSVTISENNPNLGIDPEGIALSITDKYNKKYLMYLKSDFEEFTVPDDIIGVIIMTGEDGPNLERIIHFNNDIQFVLSGYSEIGEGHPWEKTTFDFSGCIFAPILAGAFPVKYNENTNLVDQFGYMIVPEEIKGIFFINTALTGLLDSINNIKA